MNLVRGKIFGLTPCIPIFFKTGSSFLPNRLKAARDCQTSITRQPPGIGPAMCASTPLTGQSASLFLRPFNVILTLFSYLARDVAPRNSKRTAMGMGHLRVSANLESVSGSGGDVRFGSEADICSAQAHVRFTPESGHVRCNWRCLLWARSRHRYPIRTPRQKSRRPGLNQRLSRNFCFPVFREVAQGKRQG